MYSAHYSCQILIISEFSRHIFDKYSNTKFHENPSSGSQAVPCGQTDMTKLIVAFRNFANAPKNTQKAIQGIPTRSIAVQVITKQAYNIRDANRPSNAFVITFRRVRILAKSTYLLRHVRLSVHMYQYSSHWADFREF
jgi:hypothetical protein